MNTLPTEHERRLNNVISIGIVDEVNHKDALCTVVIEDNVTDWLPFGGMRMGNVKIWNPPSVGEQVLVLSENGELDTAVVVSSFDYESNKQPSSNPNSVELHCKDGAKFVYDHSLHKLDVNLPSDSTTTVQSNTITVNSDDITFNSGTTTFNSDDITLNCKNYSLNSNQNDQNGVLVINGLPYLDHLHDKVTPGYGVSGKVKV